MQGSAFIHADSRMDTSGLSAAVPWWSFTKTVLAIAALRLVEDGSLVLDGPIPGAAFTLR